MREGAVHRLLDTRTQATRVRAPVKVRPQNSHVVKLERCAKLTDNCQILGAPTAVVTEMEQQQSSGEILDADFLTSWLESLEGSSSSSGSSA